MRTSSRTTSGPRAARTFNGVKVFSATVFSERDRLGERATQWVLAYPELDIIDIVVTQSSDASFHCLTISIFYCD